MVQNTFFTLWLQTQANSQSSYQQGLQRWQQSVADFWQMPSAYWQTVGSIMGVRSKAVQWWWQSLPVQAAEYGKCQTWPQFCGQSVRWYGQQAMHGMYVNATTQSYQMNLLNQWQSLAQRNMPPRQGAVATEPYRAASPVSQATQTSRGPSFSIPAGNLPPLQTGFAKPRAQAAAVPTSSPISGAAVPPLQTGFAKPRAVSPAVAPVQTAFAQPRSSGSVQHTSTAATASVQVGFIPRPPMSPAPLITPAVAASPKTTRPTVVSQSASATKSATKASSAPTSGIAATAAEALAALTRQQGNAPQTVLGAAGMAHTSAAGTANGTTGTAEAHTVSSTATSVARTNTTAGVAAAAARRSVVARRTQRRSRMARPR